MDGERRQLTAEKKIKENKKKEKKKKIKGVREIKMKSYISWFEV